MYDLGYDLGGYEAGMTLADMSLAGTISAEMTLAAAARHGSQASLNEMSA
jgi:hypothetical protein